MAGTVPGHDGDGPSFLPLTEGARMIIVRRHERPFCYLRLLP